jgi:hypothetical protein
MSGSKRFVAIARNPRYSPRAHRYNDTAIIRETAAVLQRCGWSGIEMNETDVERGEIPLADVYLNMCQGARASRALLPLERTGARLFNRPSSVLNCHRHRLVKLVGDAGVAFPRTLILSTKMPSISDDQVTNLFAEHDCVWLKRGDVHAETSADVVCVTEAELGNAIAGFAARGIERCALQAHVPGPVVKFYGVMGSGFFRWYDAALGPSAPQPAIDEQRLRSQAFRAGSLLGLEVFGGDAILKAPDHPILIDINDWPSFAPFRAEAAEAIAARALDDEPRSDAMLEREML